MKSRLDYGTLLVYALLISGAAFCLMATEVFRPGMIAWIALLLGGVVLLIQKNVRERRPSFSESVIITALIALGLSGDLWFN